MTHIFPALLAQLLLSPFSWWAGVLFAGGYYLGREMAQAEYRVIEQYYLRRSKMPWYGAFERRAWDKKSMLDWILPLTAVLSVALFMEFYHA